MLYRFSYKCELITSDWPCPSVTMVQLHLVCFSWRQRQAMVSHSAYDDVSVDESALSHDMSLPLTQVRSRFK